MKPMTVKKPTLKPQNYQHQPGMQMMPSHVSDPRLALREALLRKMKGQ